MKDEFRLNIGGRYNLQVGDENLEVTVESGDAGVIRGSRHMWRPMGGTLGAPAEEWVADVLIPTAQIRYATWNVRKAETT